MTSYNSAGALLIKLPGIPQTTTSQGYTQTVSIIDHHLDAAYGFVNSKLARRYSVPFSSCPRMVLHIEEDIAAYRVMRSLYTRDGQNQNSWAKEHYDLAMTMLDDIQAGKIDVVNSAGAIIKEVDIDEKLDSTMADYTPIFERDADTSWSIDEDLLDDIETSRE